MVDFPQQYQYWDGETTEPIERIKRLVTSDSTNFGVTTMVVYLAMHKYGNTPAVNDALKIVAGGLQRTFAAFIRTQKCIRGRLNAIF